MSRLESMSRAELESRVRDQESRIRELDGESHWLRGQLDGQISARSKMLRAEKMYEATRAVSMVETACMGFPHASDSQGETIDAKTTILRLLDAARAYRDAVERYYETIAAGAAERGER